MHYVCLEYRMYLFDLYTIGYLLYVFIVEWFKKIREYNWIEHMVQMKRKGTPTTMTDMKKKYVIKMGKT